MTIQDQHPAAVPTRMRAVRLTAPQGPAALTLQEETTPQPRAGEALVRVHAAAITRDELEWPEDRLPAIPSYELSGIVVAVEPGAEGATVGEHVYALAPFDRDGAAAEYIAMPAELLAPAPRSLSHVERAAVPLAALSAWQGLFDHGRLERGQRVLIHGAAGGVGHFATQLAHWRGAHVIGTASPAAAEQARLFGAAEVVDAGGFEQEVAGVDLVFDTAGGTLLERSPAALGEGGRIVSIAEEPPASLTNAAYFVVEPNRDQLVEIASLIDGGQLRPAIDSVFGISDARAAFERSMAGGKRGKVVIRIAG